MEIVDALFVTDVLLPSTSIPVVNLTELLSAACEDDDASNWRRDVLLVRWSYAVHTVRHGTASHPHVVAESEPEGLMWSVVPLGEKRK